MHSLQLKILTPPRTIYTSFGIEVVCWTLALGRCPYLDHCWDSHFAAGQSM